MEKRITSRTLYGIDLFLKTDLGKLVQFLSIIATSVISWALLIYCHYQVIALTSILVWNDPNHTFSHTFMFALQAGWAMISVCVDLIPIGCIIETYYYKIFDPKTYAKKPDDTCIMIGCIMLTMLAHLLFVGVQLVNYFFLASDLCTWICPFRAGYSEDENYLYASHGMFLLLLLEILVVIIATTFPLYYLKDLFIKCRREVSDGLKEFDSVQLKPNLSTKNE